MRPLHTSITTVFSGSVMESLIFGNIGRLNIQTSSISTLLINQSHCPLQTTSEFTPPPVMARRKAVHSADVTFCHILLSFKRSPNFQDRYKYGFEWSIRRSFRDCLRDIVTVPDFRRQLAKIGIPHLHSVCAAGIPQRTGGPQHGCTS